MPRFTLEQAREKAKRVQRNRANTKQGDKSEAQVMRLLVGMGFRCVRPIHTGWRILRKSGRIVGASPKAAVVGDIAAIMHGGRSVLVEVKDRPDRLSYGDIEQHQHEALKEHASIGGLSLVAWVRAGEVAIMDYRQLCMADDAKLKKGKRLQWEQAQDLQMIGRCGSVF